MKQHKRRGWRVSPKGSVYKVKGKQKSRRKTFKNKSSAKRYAKKRY
jgi:hypothetical protein